MAIKINGATAIRNNGRATLKCLNPGAFASAPDSAEVGDFYYDTTEEQLFVWTGTEWK